MLVAPTAVPSFGLLSGAGSLGKFLLGSSSDATKSVGNPATQSGVAKEALLREESGEIAPPDIYEAPESNEVEEFNRIVSLHDEYRRSTVPSKGRLAWQYWMNALERHLDQYAPKNDYKSPVRSRRSAGRAFDTQGSTASYKVIDDLFVELENKVKLYNDKKIDRGSLDDALREMQGRIQMYRMNSPPSAERVNEMQESLDYERTAGNFPDWQLMMKELDLADALNRFDGMYNQQAHEKFLEMKQLLYTGGSFERLSQARGLYQNAIAASWFK
jgi:hypothetical protein